MCSHSAGDSSELFVFISANDGLAGGVGTSLASPLALRTALGIRALFGNRLSPLALKALLIHTATPHDHHDPDEHGWGRILSDIEQVVVCHDGVARVVYQGTLTPAQYLRAQLPIPSTTLQGKVAITATLAYATQVEPEQPSDYTCSGLELVFRPNADRSRGPGSRVAKSSPFFKKGPTAVATMRSGAYEWETVRHATRSMYGSSLHDPVFDIHYNARFGGHDGTSQAQKLRYAMVITVESKHTPNLYDEVLRHLSQPAHGASAEVGYHSRSHFRRIGLLEESMALVGGPMEGSARRVFVIDHQRA